ncbi:hypothetical protein D3C85_322470 [compost metagenome]
MNFKRIIKNDPLVKMITGKSSTTKRRKTSSKGKLTASEKRIVSAVARRTKTKTTKRKRRY